MKKAFKTTGLFFAISVICQTGFLIFSHGAKLGASGSSHKTGLVEEIQKNDQNGLRIQVKLPEDRVKSIGKTTKWPGNPVFGPDRQKLVCPG
jgi:hypothetical protein